MIYEAEKDVLLNTNYKLEDELDKIYFLYTKNKITKEQVEELEELARENANPVNSYAPIQEQIDNIYTELKNMRAGIKELKGQEVEEPTEPEPVEEYPEYVQPTGAHDAYNTGDKITYNNKKYVCKMDGCVWTPDAYPAGWEKVVEETENSTENAEVVAENTEENESEE